MIDIAEPGLGLGLGLGRTSDSRLESDSVRRLYVASGRLCAESEREEIEYSNLERLMPVVSDEEDWPESTLYDIPVSFITITDLSNRSSFKVEERELGSFVRVLGFRPLSSTFFRALIPIQSTSCFMASRSETVRLGAVRLIVLARGKVP